MTLQTCNGGSNGILVQAKVEQTHTAKARERFFKGGEIKLQVNDKKDIKGNQININ